MNSALLEIQNVSKAFGDCVANRSVSFAVQPGSIHALVGENGAGKSTIVKIIFGMYRKDEGQILFRGSPIDFSSPIVAKKKGIGMVHQHFMLAGPMCALDHIFLDEPSNVRFTSLLKPLSKKSKKAELEKLAERYHMPVPWDQSIENLSVGIQQRIEILKLLHNQADVLILDEPTAVLTPQEVQALFTQLRELRNAGKTVLLITHKLKEVMSLADTVTVFRQGSAIATKKVSETNPLELSELMVGRKLKEFSPPNIQPSQQTVFEVKDFSSPHHQNLNFKIHSHEVLGIAGVEGNGQSELIEYLLSPKQRRSEITGDILWKQKSILSETAGDLKARGYSYFPEDRLHQGALIGASVEENFILGQHRAPVFQEKGRMLWKKIRSITESQIKEFDVRPQNATLEFQNLSGGNQQKLVVARELFRKPSFLLAAQPTRGVDIGAIERIHTEILNLRNQGGSVLLISSDLDELMKLADRILVMYCGKIVGELSRNDFNEMILGRMMTGVQA
jgi:simple sugar transport system ATP-binding protein